jgi:plastocyanin
MRRRTALATTLTLLLVAPAAARADTATVNIPGKFFSPARTTTVAGDTVAFRNQDIVAHDVRIGGGLFDSSTLSRFGSWSQRIDQSGSYPFICTLHPFMSGNLDVVGSTLSAAPDVLLAGESLTLSGRATAGTAHVGVEQSVSGGEWAAVGGGATPAADGTFAVAVPAVAGASYRITTPAGPGQVVTPRVTARVDVHLQVMRMRGRTTVHVHTTPATTGLTATLQLYSRWRFRWRSAQRVKLDAQGGASFRLPAAQRRYVRVALSRGARGPALVFSDVRKLWNGHAARDPDTIAPHGGGEHVDRGPGGGGPGGGHTGH